MRTHTLYVADRRISIDDRELIQYTVGEDTVSAELDEDWAGLEVSLTFEDDAGVKITPPRQEDGSWVVPWEVLRRVGTVYAILEGRSEDGKILEHAAAQTPFNVVAARTGAGGNLPTEPTVTEVRALVDEMKKTLKEAKEVLAGLKG